MQEVLVWLVAATTLATDVNVAAGCVHYPRILFVDVKPLGPSKKGASVWFPSRQRLSHEGILSCKFCKVGLVGLSYFSFSLNLEDKISWR
jgi:hypothetical protein